MFRGIEVGGQDHKYIFVTTDSNRNNNNCNDNESNINEHKVNLIYQSIKRFMLYIGGLNYRQRK